MTKKKYDTISTLYRKRARHPGRISKSSDTPTQSNYNNPLDDDRHTVRVRTILYLQHRQRMLETQ